jgi:hypothetical protein
MGAIEIPQRFVRTMIEMHRDAGQAWLDELPVRVAEYECRWAIQVAPPFANLSYNYVAPAVRADGSQAILKLGMPHPELSSETAALRHYDGHGSARLLEANTEGGALLIERLLPGDMLLDLTDDDEATRITAQVMRARANKTNPPANLPDFYSELNFVYAYTGTPERVLNSPAVISVAKDTGQAPADPLEEEGSDASQVPVSLASALAPMDGHIDGPNPPVLPPAVPGPAQNLPQNPYPGTGQGQ